MSDLIPPDLSLGGLTFLLASAFIAALARGFSGFGAALIFLPLAATVVVALRQLPQQGLPSDVVVPGLLDGVGNVLRLVHKQLLHPHRGPAALGAEADDPPPAATPGVTPARARS